MRTKTCYEIAKAFNAEMIGPADFGHGQIDSLGDAQRYVQLLGRPTDSAADDHRRDIPLDLVVKAFLEVRNDRGSTDLYVADPDRNKRFLSKCRQLGIQGSDYAINKKLLYARKLGHLRKLRSVKTSFDSEDYAFASEYAATELRYETRSSIDDILCNPLLAARFDAIASGLAPGFSSLEYRWAILSIRKSAGRSANKWKPGYPMPSLAGQFGLVHDPLELIPRSEGVYLISEKDNPLYARSTHDLRHGVELHRRPSAVSALADASWRPALDDFIVSYAVVSPPKLLRPVETKIIEERKPLFNVPRSRA